MGRTKIFENWTFQRPLPEPFGTETAKRGKKDSTDLSSISIHNHMTRGKRATLHGATLRALIAAADLMAGNDNGAFGYEKKLQEIEKYYLEYVKDNTVRMLVYNPKDGSWRGMAKSGSAYGAFPKIGQADGSGKELLLLIACASFAEGPIHDDEFAKTFKQFQKLKADGFSNLSDSMDCAFRLCDNLYRRIENADSLGTAGIPFVKEDVEYGNIPAIQKSKLKDYMPTVTEFGVFQVFSVNQKGSRFTIGEIKEKYKRNVSLTDEEKTRIPSLPETYDVPEDVVKITEAVCKTPMRVFMMAGESGTGKTTSAKMVAQLLGLPYYSFTCGEATDEVDLVSSMIPNTGNQDAPVKAVMPGFQDMMLDPATALAMVTDVYEEDADYEYVFRKILKNLYDEGYQAGQREKDYVMVESSIVTGCRRPSVVEIQERSVISKPGTLVKLNGLLDDGAAITLTNGEVVSRNPDTVIILTTNMDYKGCRGFNESVLSRMRMILYAEPLSAEDMVERVVKRGPVKNKRQLKKMADTVCAIQKYCREEMVTGGVCGYREYEDWVWAAQIEGDVCRAARNTVVAKAAPEKETREEIYKTQILTRFQEKQAA